MKKITMNLTKLIRPWFLRRIGESERWFDRDGAERVQRAMLAGLLRRGAYTVWGRDRGFAAIKEYERFRETQPLLDYEAIRPLVERMIRGERSVLWPGATRRYAQSSGTSGGKSKFVPITDDSLRECHYRGASDVVSRYLAMNPESRLFSGRSFILGGSYANELRLDDPRVRVGDLSATLIDRINPLVNLVRVPSKRVALMADWEKKLPALVEASSKADITNISGVPSWFLMVIKEVMKARGTESIHDVWPRLEVFFHGGIAFGPYRREYEAITDPSRMHYVETYNASEGFFAVQDREGEPGMLLLADCGVFYEFLPLGEDDPRAALPLWEVHTGDVYELIISSCNGLWRYRIGDTVRIETADPVRITIAGRTKAFINAFGEELMVYNADRALERVCAATSATVADYTVAPVFAEGNRKGHHQWLVEFTRRPSCPPGEFAAMLDRELRRENSDYDAKRSKNIFLDPPELVEARPGLFDRWLGATGKRGGQRKVPRLSNDRRVIDPLLEMNSAL
ncbi:MAG: GH3 auxin-responsive promoter family protein [Clostridium sp.]|nr:GH3 auxin-responsive promoter family protein [Clostridium sp.]